MVKFIYILISRLIQFKLGRIGGVIRMINFKKGIGKVGKIKKDFEISIDTIINKNLEIDDTDLDGEKVMMNLDKGEYFMMNEVGSRIWEIINETMNVKGIVDALRSEYEVDEETCTDTVIEFLERLNNADLIRVS